MPSGAASTVDANNGVFDQAYWATTPVTHSIIQSVQYRYSNIGIVETEVQSEYGSS